jgi:hypothetical protein
MTRAKEIGIHFAFAESEKRTSHFSTLKTMKEVSLSLTSMSYDANCGLIVMLQWMENILQPYIQETIDTDPELQLDPDQKADLLLDCYPVHTGEVFHSYVHQHFPNVFLVFMPAN